MSLPFTDQECFFIVMLAFVVIGFMRGWRRELVSLVFVLLAAFLMNPTASRTFGEFLARVPGSISFFLTGRGMAPGTTSNIFGPWGALLGFAVIVVIGYLIGNKAFPRPATPQDRFIGVVPALISGAFVLAFLSNYIPKGPAGQSLFTVAVQAPDPTNYIPVIFVAAVVALVIALIASRTKKTPAKK